MNKYIDVDRLIAEIQRHKISNYYSDIDDYETELYKIIASLQQERPEVDLKNEIITQWSKCNPTDEGMGSEYAIIAVEQFDAIARHFYNLNLMKKSVKRLLNIVLKF